jgi:hypothetical protein
VLILFTLLAGFVPLLQVTFFALLEDFYPGRLAVKDRDKTHRITGVILINFSLHIPTEKYFLAQLHLHIYLFSIAYLLSVL